MNKGFLLLSIFLVYPCYAILDIIKYDAALEIQEVNANEFNNFSIEYNISNDNDGWTKIDINNSETFNGNLFLATGIDTEGSYNGKVVYFRIKNSKESLVSDHIEFTIFPKRVTFLKIIKSNITNSLPSCTLKHLKVMPYYEIVFPVKKEINQNKNKTRLKTPLPKRSVKKNTVLHYSWDIYNFASAGATIYLTIGKDDVELEKINVTGVFEYDWLIPVTYFYGEYWWQISIEYAHAEINYSEKRKLLIGDTIDTDNDGYYDEEEIARNSNPYNSKNIPLIILTDPYCKNGYLGQQYYLAFEVNDKEGKTFWRALSELPRGLVFTEHGILYGIPQEIGIFVFNIEVINEEGKKDQARFYLNINNSKQSSIKIGKGKYN